MQNALNYLITGTKKMKTKICKTNSKNTFKKVSLDARF